MADTLDTLGKIIGPGHGRDAVHIAVIAAVASGDLEPGTHVGFLPDGTAADVSLHVGIVDPFLKDTVYQGQTFWLMLYPRKITSLRHVWTHPGIPDEGSTVVPPGPTKEESERWLREWFDGKSNDLPVHEFDEMVAMACNENAKQEYRNDGHSIVAFGISGHAEIPKDFWWHLENWKGQKFEHADYFTCSC